MEKLADFVLGTSDPLVTGMLQAPGLASPAPTLDRRYTQDEDFFLVLDRPYVVEPFEIHHPVSEKVPSARYLAALRSAVQAWTSILPGVFSGLTWGFDPKDLFHPLFVQVLSARDKRYLFVLRPDLTFRGGHATILDRGGNDTTPRYSTRRLFLEAEVVPLHTWEAAAGEKRLYLPHLFPETWMGEDGRGYFVTGRWLDQEISRLISRAGLPEGTRTFPHYPLRCRYQTLAARCLDPSPAGRKRAAQSLEAAWPVVSPWADRILAGLKDDPYRDDHPLLAPLRKAWGSRLSDQWGRYRIEPYLNETEQKEYRYHEV